MRNVPRRLVPILLLVALAAVAVAVTACGDEQSGGQSAQQILKQTFSGDKQVDSGVLNMSLSAEFEGKGATAQQIEEPVSVKVSGPFQSRGEDALPLMDLKLSAGVAGQAVSAGVVSTGGDGFIEYQGSYYKVPDKTFSEFKKDFERRQRKERSSDQPSIASLGISPQKWLEAPKVSGDEEVGGAKATHITADVNVGNLVTDVNDLLGQAGDLGLTAEQRRQLPKAISKKTRQELEDSVKDAQVDIWVGKDDKVLRKLQVEVEFKAPKGLTGAAAGIASGKLAMVLGVSKLNEKQTIKAPKKAGDLSDLQQQLSALSSGALGGAGAGGGSGSSGSSAGGSSGGDSVPNTLPEQQQKLRDLGGGKTGNLDAKRAQKYLSCAEKAKTVDDLQACADKLK